MRTVKAFSLEDEMRRRLAVSVAAVEHESNKMARVGNRASPIMETLGGFAIALAVVYGGYRIIETGATPGAFVSFIAAFLLAYEPAKRLARPNIDLNNKLVGVRVLYEVVDSPPGEPSDDDRPPLKLDTARLEFANVRFGYRPGTPALRGMSFVAQPGKVTALVGPYRRAVQGADDARRRASADYHHACRLHPRGGGRSDRRIRPPRRALT